MRQVQCFIGLGSNLDGPVEQVSSALIKLEHIPDTQLVQHSGLYRSDPVGPQGQPDYINAVAELHTELEAHLLLDQLQAIEKAHKRRRIQHWGPRTLDLDILLYGDSTIESERLRVPHPFMAERAFVLYPLAEIAPGLKLPNGVLLADLLTKCPLGTLEPLAL